MTSGFARKVQNWLVILIIIFTIILVLKYTL